MLEAMPEREKRCGANVPGADAVPVERKRFYFAVRQRGTNGPLEIPGELVAGVPEREAGASCGFCGAVTFNLHVLWS